MKNQTIFELYTDDDKSKYSSNSKEILQICKKIMKLYTKWTSEAATAEFVRKIPNKKKVSNEQFNLCEAEISFDEIIKSTNSETNNKPTGNDGLTAELWTLSKWISSFPFRCLWLLKKVWHHGRYL